MNVTIAAVQMNSHQQPAHNLQLAEQLVKQAARAGASFVLLPEYFYCMGQADEDRLALAEPFADGPLQTFLAHLAREQGIWLSAGTVPIASPDAHRIFNSNLLFDPQGQCVGRYDKIHLFGFDNGQESYLESRTLYPGQTIQTFQTPFGTIRPSICYDLRFPELYRHQAGYAFITAPAAFTYTTGQAHWEILLRARAVENQCFVIAAAQTGLHPNGKRTYGHSMIIDPWGQILAQQAEGNGVVMARIDLTELARVRRNLPALDNRIF